MTARVPVSTNLIVGIILPVYSMIEEDIAALSDRLEQQITIEYRKTIQAQLNLYRCQKTVTGPDATSLAWIQDYATKTAEGIAKTYNSQLSNEISRLFQSNSRGNRYYYIKALEAWVAQRNSHKIPSIALNAAQAVREYAQQRFREENGITGRFHFVGPPPVCPICTLLKALGVVSEAQANKYGNAQHPGCPHEWSQLIPQAMANCAEAWTG